MSKAEREAVKNRIKDLMNQGIDKEVARAMAKAELIAGIIKPVVY